mmetsp:Transcript_8277/g.19618  ORF Transcript_8277/g.19618 Transcript_8277/m.19618 type:complete len:149 (+) Transcript_8277:159-605(+)
MRSLALEYILVGSANINSRSLEGFKDTELAVGCWQPGHMRASGSGYPPQGGVHCFRMQLWAEHMGRIEPCFFQPESLECVRQVRSTAQKNQKRFFGSSNHDMESHLTLYPYVVDTVSGQVTANPTTIPDSRASVRGRRSAMLPDVITA